MTSPTVSQPGGRVEDWEEEPFAVGYGDGPDDAEGELRELRAEVLWLRRVEALVRDDLEAIERALGHPWQAMRDLLGE
jgi:hypothetical protein